jgi:hypothetical protein
MTLLRLKARRRSTTPGRTNPGGAFLTVLKAVPAAGLGVSAGIDLYFEPNARLLRLTRVKLRVRLRRIWLLTRIIAAI